MQTMIVAIIPAYNEGKLVGQVIEKTKEFVDKVIVIDDGSKDNTYSTAMQASPDILIRHPINGGKGLALQTGFEAAFELNPSIIITIDADLQHDPNDIPRLVEALKDADIVIGARSMNNQMPGIFKFGNRFLCKMFNLFFNNKLKDPQSGLRAFRGEIYNHIRWESTGYFVETEMLANACKNGIRCKEIKIATRYLDKYKGTTVIDGITIFLHMIYWRIKQW